MEYVSGPLTRIIETPPSPGAVTMAAMVSIVVIGHLWLRHVNSQWSIVSGHWSVVSGQWSVVIFVSDGYVFRFHGQVPNDK
jgi:hypothetical protein